MPLEQPPVWSTYLDLENDFIPWLNSGNLTGNTQQLTMALDFACEWVQQYLQQPIAPTEITEYQDGWTGLDGSYLMMKYRPIIAVSSVLEFWGVNGQHTLSEQTPQDQSAQDSYQLDYLTGRIIRSFPGLVPRPWYPGSRNIIITYTAGYLTVPQTVKVATLEYAKYWYKQTFDPRQNKAGTYDDDTGAQLWPGTPNRVAELLTPFREIVIA